MEGATRAGNLVEAEDFDYVTSEDVLEECRTRMGDVAPGSYQAGNTETDGEEDNPASDIDTPLYSVDALVRRARALQLTPAARRVVSRRDD